MIKAILDGILFVIKIPGMVYAGIFQKIDMPDTQQLLIGITVYSAIAGGIFIYKWARSK